MGRERRLLRMVSLSTIISSQNAVESKNSKFELGLPSCYEGIFPKAVRYSI